MKPATKKLEDYKRLPYTLRVEPVEDSDGSRYWTAEYVEIRGCKTEGETDVLAIANLQELFDDFVTSCIEDGYEIPEPKSCELVNPTTWTYIKFLARGIPQPTQGTLETQAGKQPFIKSQQYGRAFAEA